MSRKISHSLINGRTGAGTAGQGLKVEWDSTEDGELHWMDVDESSLEAGPTWYGDRGVAMQNNHNGSYGTRMDYINISSTGDSADFGDQACLVFGGGAASNGTRGTSFGGYCYGGTGGYQNAIKYITLASLGNVTDAGDLLEAKEGMSGISDGTYGYSCGYADYNNPIWWFNISTVANATDFGDMSQGRLQSATIGNNSRGIMAGGMGFNVIDYITMATTGNATDFGDLLNARNFASASQANDATRGLIMGGTVGSGATPVTNVIEYITISTTGNSTDFGDLTVARRSAGNTNNSTRAVLMGGTNSSSSTVNTMDYVTIQTTGNSTDFGDMYTTQNTSSVLSGD